MDWWRNENWAKGERVGPASSMMGWVNNLTLTAIVTLNEIK